MAASKKTSIDIGAGNVKKRDRNGLSGFPSILSPINSADDSYADFQTSDPFIITTGFESNAIGETVREMGLMPVSVAHESRIKDKFYKTMFMAAMSQSYKDLSGDIKVVLSLPPKFYWQKDTLKESLCGEYEYSVSEKGGWRKVNFMLPFQNIAIIPEGFGTLCSMLFTPEGFEIRDVEYTSQDIGIIDVGTYTTDLLHFSKLSLQRGTTTSVPQALSRLHAAIDQFANAQGVTLQRHELDGVFHAGYFLREGEEISVTNVIEQWAANLADVIVGNVRTHWNGGNMVRWLILTGGGANVVYPYLLRAFKHVVIAEAKTSEGIVIPPFYLNSEGGYRFLKMKERVNGK